MVFGLTTGGLVRAASGLLFVLFALVCAFLARRPGVDRRVAWGLTLFCAGFGTGFILNNLSVQRNAAIAVPGVSLLAIAWYAATGGVVLLASRYAARPSHAWIALGIVGAYAGTGSGLALSDPSALLAQFAVIPSAAPMFLASQLGQRVLTAASLAFVALLALRASDGERAPPTIVLLAAAFAIYPAIAQGVNLPTPTNALTWTVRLFILLVLALTVALWLRALEHGAGRGALLPAFAIPAAALGGMLDTALQDDPNTRFGLGIARSVALLLVALAIFRHDLLGAGLRTRTAHRASGAAVGLALTIIVAQVAQNYVQAEYGLLLGGVIAGALLLLAAPVERALGSRVDGGKEDSFRAAVRMALKDGHVTREEDRDLVVLADHLGIRPARAYELRDEEERARGAK